MTDFIPDLDFILNSIGSFSDDEPYPIYDSNDDGAFRKKAKHQISIRDEQYTELLCHFVKITKFRNIIKEIFKWLFLLATIVALVLCSVVVFNLFVSVLATNNFDMIIQLIPVLLTAFVGFISTIIVIPTTIAKFLFNTEEDKNITSIIQHTQEHDVDGRSWATEKKPGNDQLSEPSTMPVSAVDSNQQGPDETEEEQIAQ